LTTEQTTLEELRAKTDRQLALLIERRLRFAIACLLSRGGSRTEAEKVYTQAATIIPLIRQIPVKQREHLESLFRQAGKLLTENASYQEKRVYAAC
jgi:hypothetical protein